MASDFFGGGLALGAFSAAAATLGVLLLALYRFFVRRIWVSVTLDNRSSACRNFCIWMEHNKILADARHVRITDSRWARGTKGYAPASGQHWFYWKGAIYRLGRDISEKSKVGAAHNQRPMEVLYITAPFGHVINILNVD